MNTIVLALGGNALGKTPSEQKITVKTTAKTIVDLYNDNHNVVIVHGNGPQVGWINNSFMKSFQDKISKEILPFPECGAMSQGYIGYHIQNAVQNELLDRKIKGNVISLVCQTIVDKNDPGFKDPSKPIGDFMSEKEAKEIATKNNWKVKEDAGRGWRRVVASPKPVDMPVLPIVRNLLKDNIITIVGGGGGIPVINNGSIEGVDAVIDKDSTASFIADKLKADKFIILTAVDQVKINYGKENEESLATTNLDDLNVYIKENQFAPGSMLPKILAAMEFVKNTSMPAFIGDLKDAHKIIAGKAGTIITKN
ncbi:carbamate kinase [Candidatus Mycoplasma mahonii]|uniref:carbamate kinase n=1 Tax=Candidatus Mycoplasma mahonii TaxID=3004105 RepID=UPI0026EC47CE|nr:carbamate kinase [Candidatus Mycoplasma mahonii]WKX02571.1 carbamate kinase [Candidatus Mycoplasma mahonii]